MVAEADEQVAEMFRQKGWSVLTSGWPDLLAYKPFLHKGEGPWGGEAIGGGEIMAIELKRGSDRMRPNQEEMRKVFVQHFGIPFYIAKDDDIKGIMIKKGRVVVPWAKLSDSVARANALANEISKLRSKLDSLQQQFNMATEIFEQVPTPSPLVGDGKMYIDRKYHQRTEEETGRLAAAKMNEMFSSKHLYTEEG